MIGIKIAIDNNLKKCIIAISNDGGNYYAVR